MFSILVFIFTAFAVAPFSYADEVPAPTEIIVKYKEEYVDLERRSGEWRSERLADKEGVEIVDTLVEQNISVVVPTDGETLDEAITELENNPAIEYAEPNYYRQTSTIDPFWFHQWSLKNTGQLFDNNIGKIDGDIDMEEAWDVAGGNLDEIIVAVIDTGVNYNHADLANQMWDGSNCVNASSTPIAGGCIHGYDFYNDDNDPIPTGFYHGTQVSGIIAAEKDNNKGIAGIAPNVKIMALKIDNPATGGLPISAEVKAIDFAIANGAKIINASFGSNGFSQSEFNAIKRFEASGGIFIAAAGNISQSTPEPNHDTGNLAHRVYPSDYDSSSIISVASTNNLDNMSGFSHYGVNSVDLAAPGSSILSPSVTGSYDWAYGTSFAAPHVAGVAALMWGYDENLTASEIKDIILATGDPIPALAGKTVTGKRLNAYNAMLAIQEVTPTPVANVNIAMMTVLNGSGLPDEEYLNYKLVVKAGDTTISPVKSWRFEFFCPSNVELLQIDGVGDNKCNNTHEFVHEPDTYGQEYLMVRIKRSDDEKANLRIRYSGLDGLGTTIASTDRNIALLGEKIIPTPIYYIPVEPTFESSNDYEEVVEETPEEPEEDVYIEEPEAPLE